MKFKFIGKSNLLVDTLTTNQVYNIIQFEKSGRYLIAYIIDDNNELLYIPYISVTKFNEEWSYMNND